ncbi:MAG: toll/interleukin-1 receptor domain-containing protein [Chitinophagaceae bacterium]
MATLREYFYKDFPITISFTRKCIMSFNKGQTVTFLLKLIADFSTNSKFCSFYFDSVADPIIIFNQILSNIEKFLQNETDFSVQDMFGNVSVKDNWLSLRDDLKFTGRVIFYYNDVIDRKRFSNVQSDFRNMGFITQCFDLGLATERNEKQKPLAFVSHDTRDIDFARDIAIGLEKRMCTVWFSEFTLKVGDPLRESIEKGLLQCKKCILVLSPNFIKNEGWTKTEFNTIFTREIVETKKVVLPVWYNVNANDVYSYSPTLSDRVGVNAEKGLEFVVDKLQHAIFANE